MTLNVNILDVERADDPEYVLFLIRFELIDDNIKKFCSLVDDSYKFRIFRNVFHFRIKLYLHMDLLIKDL